MSLKNKIFKNTTLKYTSSLAESVVFNKKSMVPTEVPIINVALSGDPLGGLTSGLTVIAGKSRHFKSGFTLLMAKAFLAKNPDGVVLFYDSEFGTPLSYFSNYDIMSDSVVHSPITDIEEFKFDLMSQLDGLERGDKVLIIVDSVGNLASKKEKDDALDMKSVADMTRAKALKSLFRMVTPYLTLKDIPMIVVNHVYDSMAAMSKASIMSGGQGPMLSADTVWILGKRKDKDGSEVIGNHFVINIEKSRYVREGVRFFVEVSFEEGINKCSGLFDAALEVGWIIPTAKGSSSYQVTDPKTGELLEKKWFKSQLEYNEEFWKDMLASSEFVEAIRKNYAFEGGKLLKADTEEVSLQEIEE